MVTTPATSTAEGVTTYSCTVCGATKTEVIERLPAEQTYTVCYHSNENAPAAEQRSEMVYGTPTNILTVAQLGFNDSSRIFSGWLVKRADNGTWRAFTADGKYAWVERENGKLPAGYTYCLYEDGKSIYGPIPNGELHLYAQWDKRPEIVTQPVNTTVESGERAYFSVKASGLDLTYQWQYSGNGGSTWTNSSASAAKTAKLSIAGNASNAKLLYRCAVSNAKGTTYTNTVRVTLSDAKPVILTQPVNTTVKLNERAYFSVSVSGLNVTYQWQYSSNGGSTWANSTASSAKTAKLSIAGNTGNAKLLYRCKVSNDYGTVYSTTARVTISDAKPVILTQPVNTTVKLNERAYFSVSVSGLNVTYQWQYSSNGGSTWANSTASSAKTAKLSIAGNTGNAKLLYRCKVSNDYGTVYSTTARVTISDAKPVILTQPVNTTVKLNERAYFSVSVSGVNVTYQWQYSSDGGKTWKNSTAAAAKKADFSIAGTAANAKLLYRCAATNAKGTTYTNTVRVTISDIAPVVLTQPTNTTVKNGERAYFSVSVSGVNVTYQWQYSSDGGKTWKNSTAAAAKKADFSIAGTAANAKLLYRCKATNAYGSVYTSTVKATVK